MVFRQSRYESKNRMIAHMKFKNILALVMAICLFSIDIFAIEKQPTRVIKTPDKSILFNIPMGFSDPQYEEGTIDLGNDEITQYIDIISDKNEEKIWVRKLVIPDSTLNHKTSKKILDDTIRGMHKNPGDKAILLEKIDFTRNDLEWRRAIYKIDFDGIRFERMEITIYESNLYFFLYVSRDKKNLMSHTVDAFFDSIVFK